MALRWLLLIVLGITGAGSLSAQRYEQNIDERKFRGGAADGFSGSSLSQEDRLYLLGCPDRYIARGECIGIGVESNAATVLWYDENGGLLESGKFIVVMPDVSTVYKAVAILGQMKDSCRVRVCVRQDYYSGQGDGYTCRTTNAPYLIAGNDRYIALNESAALNVECYTNAVVWYDQENSEIGRGKCVVVAPQITSIYKAVVHDAGFSDSCRIVVHVNDNYAGGRNDGFARSTELPYLRGCADQYIALHDEVLLYVASSTPLIKWYNSAGDLIGSGWDIKVSPQETSIYYAVANDGRFRDTSRIMVHVNDNYAGDVGDGFSRSKEQPYLTGGPDQYIALYEEAELTVWSHSNAVKWYDSEGNFVGDGKKIGIKPLQKVRYKAVVDDGEFIDSCFVWVHVKDNFAGEIADGFAYKKEIPLYLRVCGDRYIARYESVGLYADSHTDSINWYMRDTSAADGWKHAGYGRKIAVMPDSTTLYCAIAKAGKFTDTCRITVHVNDNYAGELADGFGKNCDQPWILGYEGVNGHPCTGSENIQLKIITFGASHTYQWQKYDALSKKYTVLPDSLKKDVRETDRSATLRFWNLRPEFNGIYRCLVYNACDSVIGDTLLLHVNRCDIDLIVDMDTVYLCRGESKEVGIKILNGTTPWRYTYQPPAGGERSGYEDTSDSTVIIVRDEGVYQFTSLEDASGDIRIGSENLPGIVVIYRSEPVVKISSLPDPVCWGEETTIDLNVQNGVGPWNIWVYGDDGNLAEDMERFPVRITRRDTSLHFMATESRNYYIGRVEDQYQGNAVCKGSGEGMAVISVTQSEVVRFCTLSDNHIGQCRDINLFDLLLPEVDGRRLGRGEGTFYIDSIAIADDVWKKASLKAGVHQVYYLLDLGYCGGSSKALTLLVDSVPSLKIRLPENVCEGNEVECVIEVQGYDVSFNLERTRYSRVTLVEKIENQHIQTYLNTPVYREPVKFLQDDSCLHYVVRNIVDRYGCEAIMTVRDTLYNRVKPEVALETQYPVGSDWIKASDTLWVWDARVEVRAKLSRGNGVLADVQAVWGGDGTVAGHFKAGYETLTLNRTGVYYWGVTDQYCANIQADTLVVRQRIPGYMRFKTLLEGKTETEDLIVELRNLYGEIVAMDTCIVAADGMVTDKDGYPAIRFDNGSLEVGKEYYVVVRSEGYLPVISRKTYRLSEHSRTAILLDFTDGANVYCRSGNLENHMTPVGEKDGKIQWALSAVEVNENGLISVKDHNELKEMEGAGEGVKLKVTDMNRHKYTEVPVKTEKP